MSISSRCHQSSGVSELLDFKWSANIDIPIWQMKLDDQEVDTLNEDPVNRLTGLVREHYLKYLIKLLIRNADCSSEFFDNAYIEQCAKQMEQNVLRDCIVVKLYQKAISFMIADIKQSTENLKLHEKLKDFVPTHRDTSTQTEGNNKVNGTNSWQHEPAINSLDSSFNETRPIEEPCSNDSSLDRWENERVDSVEEFVEELAAREVYNTSSSPEDKYSEMMNSSELMPKHRQHSQDITRSDQSRKHISLKRRQHSGAGSPLKQKHFTPVLHNTDKEHRQYKVTMAGSEQKQSNTAVKTPRVLNEHGLSQSDDAKSESFFIENQSNKVVGNENTTLKQTQSSDDRDPALVKTEKTSMFERLLESHATEQNMLTLDERVAAIHGETLDLEPLKPDNAGVVKRKKLVWRYEKLYHLKVLNTKLKALNKAQRHRVESRFAELFGDEVKRREKLPPEDPLAAFKDRIAPWVVKFLMPYYTNGRIESRQLFKFTAKHVTDELIDRKQLPDEADVFESVESLFRTET